MAVERPKCRDSWKRNTQNFCLFFHFVFFGSFYFQGLFCSVLYHLLVYSLLFFTCIASFSFLCLFCHLHNLSSSLLCLFMCYYFFCSHILPSCFYLLFSPRRLWCIKLLSICYNRQKRRIASKKNIGNTEIKRKLRMREWKHGNIGGLVAENESVGLSMMML